MKQKATYHISIPSPCHQAWEEMGQKENGRYCQACQKTVVDFRNKTKNEITRHLLDNPGTCGNFHSFQLNETYTKPVNKNFFHIKWLYFIGLVCGELFAGNVKAQEKHTQATETSATETATKGEKRLLKGKIVDETGKAVESVYVQTKESNMWCKTGADGTFSIRVGDNEKLIISGQGFETQIIPIQSQKFIEVILKERNILLNEVEIIGYPPMRGKVDIKRDDEGDKMQPIKYNAQQKYSTKKKWGFFRRLFRRKEKY